MILRPELDYDKLAEIDTDRPELPAEVTEQVNILIKYDVYISRQIKQVEMCIRDRDIVNHKDIHFPVFVTKFCHG